MIEVTEELVEKLRVTWHRIGMPNVSGFHRLRDMDQFLEPMRFISMEAMEHVMAPLMFLPCPNCIEKHTLAKEVKAVPLLVVLHVMPLGAKGQCAKARCMVCDFSVQWHVEATIHEYGPMVAAQPPMAPIISKWQP